ncbi:MAG: hypothetical protein WB440_05860 [Steroidobacteraceae bacterium]|jgi:hypothetical protein
MNPRMSLLLLAGLMLARAAAADNFSEAHYDAAKDQLVITMIYRGTNPDHTFSLQWGKCRDVAGSSVHEISAEVLDSKFMDAAQTNFKTTTRIDLAGLACRPAKVTLRTAPRFYYTLRIPAAPGASP